MRASGKIETLEQKLKTKAPEAKIFLIGVQVRMNLMMQGSILDSGTINGSDSCSAVKLSHPKLDKEKAAPLF